MIATRSIRVLVLVVIPLVLVIAAVIAWSVCSRRRPAAWSLAFERTCDSPVGSWPYGWAADGSSFYWCGARFRTANGAYLDAADSFVLGSVGDGRVLRASEPLPALLLAADDRPETQPLARSDREAVVRSVRISHGGDRLAVLEAASAGPGSPMQLVLRDSRTLAVLRNVPLACAVLEESVAVLDSGGAAVIDGAPEPDGTCRARHLLIAGDAGRPATRLELGPTRPRALLLSRDGDAALVERDNGASEITALPSGRVLFTLPSDGSRAQAFALSAGHDHAAVATAASLRVFVRRDAALVESLKIDEPGPHDGLSFTADGHMLFEEVRTQLRAYRETAPEALPAAPAYRAVAPIEFHALGSGPDRLAGWDGPGGIQVRAFATRADEFAAVSPTLAAWSDAVARRYGGVYFGGASTSAVLPSLRAWQASTGRALQWTDRKDGVERGGENTVRAVEQGAWLLRVQIWIPRGASGTAVIRAFITEPLGNPQ
jgi:hypothetical protein